MSNLFNSATVPLKLMRAIEEESGEIVEMEDGNRKRRLPETLIPILTNLFMEQ